MRTVFSKLMLTAALALAVGFTDSAAAAVAQKGSFADKRDGKKYKTAKIGEQTWMAENLNYDADGSKCYEEDKPENCKKYGRLYNWEMAMKACPSGWHLPTKAEWEALESFIEKDKECSGYDAKHLKTKSGWNDNGNGTDAYGFAALPGGFFGYMDGSLSIAGDVGYWWSASEGYASSAYYRDMSYYYENAYWDDTSKSYLRSVRCLQD